MNKLLLLIFVFFTTCFYANAQCPFDKTNCRGECGRFTDEDSDGFCDFGMVTEVKPDTKQSKKDTASVKKSNKIETQKSISPKENQQTLKTPVKDTAINAITTPTVVTTDSTPAIAQEQPEIQNKEEYDKPYDFLSISIATIALYLFTMLLVKLKKIKKVTHRKIWNFILLISFLVSGILGLVLVVQINYGIAMSAFRDFLFLHVEFGIVMAIIAIIHAFWHLSYYVKMFSSKGK